MASWTVEARRFLEAHRLGHLATRDAQGAPHVVPVCYALDDAALYFIADAKPKRGAARDLLRLRNLRADPRAALVVDEWDEDWSRLAFVLVRGPARELDDATAHAAALRRLRGRYPQYERMPLDDPHAHPIVRIEPARVVMWRADAGASRASLPGIGAHARPVGAERSGAPATTQGGGAAVGRSPAPAPRSHTTPKPPGTLR